MDERRRAQNREAQRRHRIQTRAKLAELDALKARISNDRPVTRSSSSSSPASQSNLHHVDEETLRTPKDSPWPNFLNRPLDGNNRVDRPDSSDRVALESFHSPFDNLESSNWNFPLDPASISPISSQEPLQYLQSPLPPLDPQGLNGASTSMSTRHWNFPPISPSLPATNLQERYHHHHSSVPNQNLSNRRPFYTPHTRDDRVPKPTERVGSSTVRSSSKSQRSNSISSRLSIADHTSSTFSPLIPSYEEARDYLTPVSSAPESWQSGSIHPADQSTKSTKSSSYPRVSHASVESDKSALHLATIQGNLNCVRTLLHHDADVNSVDLYGATPLHACAAFGNTNEHMAIVRLLVDHGADIGARDEEGSTPLQIAAESGNDRIIGVLARLGVDVNAV